jgi:flagellar basal-body rod protein FlgG
MNDALYVAATGLFAHQSNVETIANNVANLGTTGFKKSRVVFQDLLSQAAAPTAGTSAPARHGVGVSAAQVARAFDAGELRQTDSPLDLAIQGAGFIEVLLPDGSTALTRGGTLHVSPDGHLATAEGYALKAGIAVPHDAQQLTISRTGQVTALGGTNGRQAQDLGSIELVLCPNPQDLTPLGGGLYKAPEEGARLVAVQAGEEGAGTLAQGFLEASNVKMADEMVSLMMAQRAYEMSAKVMQAADEMLGISNNLRRG